MSMTTTTVDKLRNAPPEIGTICEIVGRIIKSDIGFWVVGISAAKPEILCAIGIDDTTLEDRFRSSGVPALGGGPYVYSFECEFTCTVLPSETSDFAVTVGKIKGLKLFRRDREKAYDVTDF
jgi:hypothetical protein